MSKASAEFASEAELCAAFVAWLAKSHRDITHYAEWAGWDLLLVYAEGWQIGVQAKLRLNADVILQAAPDRWDDGGRGPDYRAILVPHRNALSTVAERLGLLVLHPYPYQSERSRRFVPSLRDHFRTPPREWLDWSPGTRYPLPPVPTDAVAGSPCPVSLTPWKLVALDVLAELEVRGGITRRQIRHLGIDPRRWVEGRWLVPGEEEGRWIRGSACPAFDRQHPTAYAAALEAARARGLPDPVTSG